MKIEKPPIIITGCARSGTSLTAGIVNLSGAYGGDMHGPNKYNARGMYENKSIKEVLDKPYLRSIGADPKGQKPLPGEDGVPGTDALPIPNDWKKRVEDLFIQQGYGNPFTFEVPAIDDPDVPAPAIRLHYDGKNGQWFIKLARACLTWPVWHHAFPNAKWVIVRRLDGGIIDSCMKTAFMNSYSNQEGWQHWIDHHKEKFGEMIEEGLNVSVFWPEQMVLGNYQPAYELIEWLGLEWHPKHIENFVSPKLWHPRKQRIREIAIQRRQNRNL